MSQWPAQPALLSNFVTVIEYRSPPVASSASARPANAKKASKTEASALDNFIGSSLNDGALIVNVRRAYGHTRCRRAILSGIDLLEEIHAQSSLSVSSRFF